MGQVLGFTVLRFNKAWFGVLFHQVCECGHRSGLLRPLQRAWCIPLLLVKCSLEL